MSYYAEVDFFAEEKSRMYCDTPLPVYSDPKDDKLYVMYHGTTAEAAEEIIRSGFKPTRDGKLGSGVYVSRTSAISQKFPKHMKGGNTVLKLLVNVGKCIKIDAKGHPLQKSWNCYGKYDCAWIPFGNPWIGSFNDRNCIADPRRIKVIGVAVGTSSKLEALIKQYKK